MIMKQRKSGMMLVWVLLTVSGWLRADVIQAPDFTLPRLDSHGEVGLHSYRGSYVLVDFWASWCEPCRESLPVYNQIRNSMRQHFGAKAFEVLAINVDITAQDGRQFIDRIRPDYPVLREDTGTTQQAYQLVDMPESFLVNPEGAIVLSYFGFEPKRAEFLKSYLNSLLAKHAR